MFALEGTGQFQEQINWGREVFLSAMYNEGVITEKQYNIMLSKYCIIIHKKKWLGSRITKLIHGKKGLEDDNIGITVAKLIYKLHDDYKVIINLLNPTRSQLRLLSL